MSAPWDTAGGLRSAKTVDGTTTQYDWDIAGGLPLLLGQHQGGTTTNLVYGPGDLVARYAYDAYGALTTNTAPAAPTPLLGYTGQYTDAETGFVYLRVRYLDPATGQFTTRDPPAASTSAPYSYAGADPVNFSDPGGLDRVGDSMCRNVGELCERTASEWEFEDEVHKDLNSNISMCGAVYCYEHLGYPYRYRSMTYTYGEGLTRVTREREKFSVWRDGVGVGLGPVAWFRGGTTRRSNSLTSGREQCGEVEYFLDGEEITFREFRRQRRALRASQGER